VSTGAPKIFLTYRREETAGHTGRIYDSLVARFGEAGVFMDVDLEPGVDFVDRITRAVGACQVLVAVIGPRWTSIQGDEGRPRLSEPGDYVRLEVETALRRPDVTVIPVLVSGAQMPEPDELPDGLQALGRRNALELSDARWRYDIGRLVAALEERVAETQMWEQEPGPEPQPEPPAPPSPGRSRPTPRVLLEAALVAGATGFAARWFGELIPTDYESDAAEFATKVLRRTETWALVGAMLAVWITALRGQRGLIPRRGLIGLAVGALAGTVGGAISAVDVLFPDAADSNEALSVGSIAAIGAIVGALIGGLWLPRRLGVGMATGVVAGALIQLVFTGWVANTGFEHALETGAQCVVIAGATVAVMVALDAPDRAAMASPRAGT
jgi:TIR domain